VSSKGEDLDCKYPKVDCKSGVSDEIARRSRYQQTNGVTFNEGGSGRKLT